MREEFEKLPEIANKIQYGAGSNKLRFNKEAQEYYCHTSSMQGMDNALFVNGSWYAFQEQWKRIDVLEKFIRLTCYIDEEGVKNSYVECTELTYVSKLSSDDADIIKELLK